MTEQVENWRNYDSEQLYANLWNDHCNWWCKYSITNQHKTKNIQVLFCYVKSPLTDTGQNTEWKTLTISEVPSTSAASSHETANKQINPTLNTFDLNSKRLPCILLLNNNFQKMINVLSSQIQTRRPFGIVLKVHTGPVYIHELFNISWLSAGELQLWISSNNFPEFGTETLM